MISESNVVWELKEQEDVDAIMRGVQSPSEETQIERFSPLSVRVGVAWLVGVQLTGSALILPRNWEIFSFV